MGRKKRKAIISELAGPNDYQRGKAAFAETWQLADGRKARAYKRVAVIDTLFDGGFLTDKEYASLAYYRDQASLADKSPVRSCCDNSPRGGDGPGVAIMSALLETGRIERDLGSLLDIARAVAVDDMSIAQWCIARYGGRERYNGKGEFVAVVPINEKRHMQMARMELRMAAHRIIV